MIRTILLISLVLIQTFALGKAPVPYCSAKPQIKEVPLSQFQTLTHSLDDMFYGYNLDLSIVSNSSSFARLNKKISSIDKVSGYFPNIISHYVEHKGNNWGKQTYILYQDMSGSYIFSYGRIQDEFHVPKLDFTVIVSNQKTVKCFGAALLLDFGLAIVDCLRIKSQSNELQNYFYYIDIPSGKVSKQVKNSMYVKYTQISKRKIMKYKDIKTGYQYLIRVYPADGVNQEQRGNTYMEIFSVRDPYDIQIMKVLDRTYLHTNTLSIIDAKVYLGDIFFLDYINGLYRLDIMNNVQVLITGRYIKDGFTKFAVYSDDLENEVLIALANNHAIYEIDWSNIRDPVMVNKYSLMEHSNVKQLIINDLFVVVQSSANTTNSTSANFQIDYTWVFSRGARTYTNAYGVINHNSSKAELQFNRQSDKLLIVDQQGITLYQISEPILSLVLGQQSRVGTSEDLVIVATSRDPNVKQPVSCQVRIKVNFVKSDDMTIYKQSYDTTANYSINYPSQMSINLDRYVLGPNITYNITNTSSIHDIPPYWIDKINKTMINLDFGIGDIIFFHVQVVPQFGQERLIYYVQDSRYFTHVIECTHQWNSNSANCVEQKKYAHTSAIHTFTTAYFNDYQGFNYFYILTFKEDLKKIYIIDYINHKILTEINYQGHIEAQIKQLASSNGFLYVLRDAVKTIDVYRLSACQQQQSCKPDFMINPSTLKALNVQYFAPLEIITDYSHPQVLFIRCKGSIVILDIDNKQHMILLDQIKTITTSNMFYRIAVNKERLVIVSDPDIVDLYSLQHIYIKNQVKYLKRLPLYHYTIQSISDIQFSDVDHMVYINAVDTKTNTSAVLMYRTNRPAAASFYGVIPLRKLYSRPGLQIQVSGFFVDFLNVKTDDGFQLFRVFNTPLLTVKDVFENFTFNIDFSNSKTKITSQLLKIESVNYPTGFETQPQLNKTLNNLKLENQGNYTWNDRKWFKGHIIGYNYTCPDCGNTSGSKVHLKQHVQPQRTIHITGYDYAQTLSGGISVYNDLFRFRINGSLHDVVNLPDQKLLQRCIKVATAFHTELIVTACQQLGRGINLYVTSTRGFKPWTWGPYRSSAYNAQNLQVAGDILMLVDTSYYPEFKFQQGAIFLYSLGLDNASGQQMDELQVIDSNDLVMAQGFGKEVAYIANAHLVFSPANNGTYRLYVTEVDGGLFVVDFTHQINRRQINILTINFVNLKQLLQANHLHLPSDASFQAVSLVSYKYNPHFYLESVIVTTKGYHNLEVVLVFDDNGNVISQILHRVYYRYGYYMAANQVRTVHGYVAMTYIIPYAYEYQTNKSRQIIAVYDSDDYEDDHDKGYSQRYILGAFKGNKTNPFLFAFNTTYDWTTNGTRIGLIVTNPYQAPAKNMYQLSLSKNLTIQIKKDFKEQDIVLIPYSDFDVKSFKMHLTSKGGDDDGGKQNVLIIIIIVLACVITVGFGVYIFILVKNKKKKKDEERASLLTQQQTDRHSIQPRTGDYVPPSAPIQTANGNKSQPEEESQSQSSQQQDSQTQVVPIKEISQQPKVEIKPENKVQKPVQVIKPQIKNEVEQKVQIKNIQNNVQQQKQQTNAVVPNENANEVKSEQKKEEVQPIDKKQPQN